MLEQGTTASLALMFAGLLIVAGLGYKISAVPFHFWAPDVYEGAPITITAFLSVASKAGGFALMIRFLTVSFLDSSVPDPRRPVPGPCFPDSTGARWWSPCRS